VRLLRVREGLAQRPALRVRLHLRLREHLLLRGRVLQRGAQRVRRVLRVRRGRPLRLCLRIGLAVLLRCARHPLELLELLPRNPHQLLFIRSRPRHARRGGRYFQPFLAGTLSRMLEGLVLLERIVVRLEIPQVLVRAGDERLACTLHIDHHRV